MNAQEIIEKLENYEGTKDQIESGYWEPISGIGHEDIDQDNFKSIFGDFEYIKVAERSNHGDHDEAETVIYFKDHNVYIMLDGYYSSQNGTDFDDGEFVQVYPKTKTVEYFSSKK